MTCMGLATSWLGEKYRISNTERIHSEGGRRPFECTTIV